MTRLRACAVLSIPLQRAKLKQLALSYREIGDQDYAEWTTRLRDELGRVMAAAWEVR